MSNGDINRRRSAQKKRRRQQQLILRFAILIFFLLLLLIFLFLVSAIKKALNKDTTVYNRQVDSDQLVTVEKYIDVQPDLDVELLTVNEYSRPGIALEEVNAIVVHWTANPGTTAIQNRGYFEGLATSKKTSASAHFIVGLSGEIVQCIPCNEIAYSCSDRNYDTIAIECCIEDEEGKFNGNTYDSLVQLVAWLVGRYDLTVDDVIRHYDVTGKDCPKYYDDDHHPEAWAKFKEDVSTYIDTYGVEKTAAE